MSGRVQDRVAVVTGSSSGNGRAIALALAAPERINVNVVCPGFVYTALTRPYLDVPEISEAVHAVTPWPGIGRADDVAGSAVFLASDEARWATGTVLTLDGGYTAP